MTTVIPLYVCPADPRSGQVQIYEEVFSQFRMPVALTSYQGVSGENILTLDGMLFNDSKIRISDVLDGTSNTLFVGERPPSFDLKFGWWYAGAGRRGTGSCDSHLGVRERNISTGLFCPPGPYDFGPGHPHAPCDFLHYWSHHESGANFLLVDGSVRFFGYQAKTVMPALASRAGGEIATVPE